MNFKDIEHAGFQSWPAFEESETDGLVFRYSQGYTKRANSINVLSHQEGSFPALVKLCENYFKDKGLPCVIRIPSFSNNQKLDEYLDRLGYLFLDHSFVLYRSLEKATFDRAENLEVKSIDEWMASFCRINESGINEHQAHLEILKRIKDTALMAVLVENEVEVACGLGVISNGYFGLFDLITAKRARNKGYATKLLNGMLNWAMTNGSTNAYLQVVAGNQSAINLYKKLGYQSCYEYWYRVGGNTTSKE